MEIVEKCADIIKEYKNDDYSVVACDSVNLEIYKGEFIVITGDSGSGKSTLLNLLGGLDNVTSGSILLDGLELTGLSDDELTKVRCKKIGFVFQDYNLIPILSVYENIILTIQIAGGEIDRTYVNRVISILGLDNIQNRFPSQLSGGQQQRVAIARAVASKPRIILADEPTGNLDKNNGDSVIKLFRQLIDEFGQTIVMVTHNERHTSICDRWYVMQDGKLSIKGVRKNVCNDQ